MSVIVKEEYYCRKVWWCLCHSIYLFFL